MKKIITITSLVMITLLLASCGVVAPNLATIELKNEKASGTTGLELKDVAISYNDTKKANIAVGAANTFDVQWWGGGTTDLVVTYYTEVSGTKTYRSTIISGVKNFDNLTITWQTDDTNTRVDSAYKRTRN